MSGAVLVLKKQPTQAATVFVPNASEVMNFAVVVPSFIRRHKLTRQESDSDPTELSGQDTDPTGSDRIR